MIEKEEQHIQRLQIDAFSERKQSLVTDMVAKQEKVTELQQGRVIPLNALVVRLWHRKSDQLAARCAALKNAFISMVAWWCTTQRLLKTRASSSTRHGPGGPLVAIGPSICPPKIPKDWENQVWRDYQSALGRNTDNSIFHARGIITRGESGLFKKVLQQMGYDGIHYHGPDPIRDAFTGEVYREPYDQWGVFDPTQIKSATHNAGTFDPTSPKVHFMPGEPGSKEFKDWFSGSKATNESGKPLMVYHGTNTKLDKFSHEFSNTGTKTGKEAFFFTSNPEEAQRYGMTGRTGRMQEITSQMTKLEQQAQTPGLPLKDLYKLNDRYQELADQRQKIFDEARQSGDMLVAGQGANIFPAYLSVKNPEVIDMKGEMRPSEPELLDIIKQAKKDGKDGIILRNAYDQMFAEGKPDYGTTDLYAAFEPEQIRTAIGQNKA